MLAICNIAGGYGDNYSQHNFNDFLILQRKDFEKLKSLLSICPKERTPEILRQVS